MNSQIEAWRVNQFKENVYHLAQQKGSRLRGCVRTETQQAKTAYYDTLGLATAQAKTGRNTDTPNLDITHSRRAVTMKPYEWATLVDKADKLRVINSPESNYSKAAYNALGRSMDDIIIAAALGTAYYGEDGTSSTTLGNTKRVACVASSGALAALTIEGIRMAKYLMDAAEVDPSIPRYFVFNSLAEKALLSTTEVTNSLYNEVKALVAGKVDEFLGFKFIRSERILNFTNALADTFKFDTSTGLYSGSGTAVAAADGKSCFAFAGDGIVLGIGEDITARVDVRTDKSMAMQPYCSMDLGGVRMEEAKVIEVLCKQS